MQSFVSDFLRFSLEVHASFLYCSSLKKTSTNITSITNIFVKHDYLDSYSWALVRPIPHVGRLGRSWAVAAQGHRVLYMAVQTV